MGRLLVELLRNGSLEIELNAEPAEKSGSLMGAVVAFAFRLLSILALSGCVITANARASPPSARSKAPPPPPAAKNQQASSAITLGGELHVGIVDDGGGFTYVLVVQSLSYALDMSNVANQLPPLISGEWMLQISDDHLRTRVSCPLRHDRPSRRLMGLPLGLGAGLARHHPQRPCTAAAAAGAGDVQHVFCVAPRGKAVQQQNVYEHFGEEP